MLALTSGRWSVDRWWASMTAPAASVTSGLSQEQFGMLHFSNGMVRAVGVGRRVKLDLGIKFASQTGNFYFNILNFVQSV